MRIGNLRNRRFLARLTAVGSAMIGAILILAAPALVQAQGVLINVTPDEHVRLPRPHVVVVTPRTTPQPPTTPYKISSLEVNASLRDQAAEVQVTQGFVNTGSRTIEVAFVFPLPPDAAVSKLTLMVDGKELAGTILNKDEARRRYEEIVRKNQDPALLEWLGGGMFQTSVFPVPPGAERKVMIRYTQLCRQDQGVTDFTFPLSTAKYSTHPVERVNVNVTIESADEIKSVYSPTHSIEMRREKHRARVSYESKNEVPADDFRLLFDVGRGKLSTRVLSYRPEKGEDGYFLLLAAPQIKDEADKPEPKTVVFVVDRSGSMSGEKIEQAKNALKFVLRRLRDGDLFNVIAYDDRVEAFRPELQRYDSKTRDEALGFVESIYAGGSTNIDGALTMALDQLKDSSRPNYVLFLTDGLPTAGETAETKIVDNAKSHNRVRARIIAFGVGYDVNSRLIDKLVRANFGQSEYVRPNEDIEARVGRLYEKFEAPVLTDVKMQFVRDEAKSSDGPVVNRLYPRETFDLFAGEQLVIVGRYRKSGSLDVRIAGQVGGATQEFSFPAKLIDESKDESASFIERLWAVRRIGEIIDELDLKGRNEELVKELVALSTRHGILTPYTAFLADETTDLRALTSNAGTAGRELEQLNESSGERGFVQRAAKGAYQSANNAAALPSISAPTPAAPPASAAPGLAGRPYSGGYSGGTRGGAAGPLPGLGSTATTSPAKPAGSADGADRREPAQAVRNVGTKSFFRRGTQWVDSTVTEAQEKQARKVTQFSPEYFDLATRHGRKLAQYLVSDEAVLLNLDGETLLIEPASN